MAGRPKTNYVPYKEAQRYAQQHGLRSRQQYWNWWDKHKPAYMPKRPEKVYREWESWNIFLNTTNVMRNTEEEKQKHQYLPYWEAVRYAQQVAKQYNLTSMEKWKEWHDSGMCDKHVPKHPDHHYAEFQQGKWDVWLGKTAHGVIQTASNIPPVVALCSTPHQPVNMATVIVDKGGLPALKEKYDEGKIGRPWRLYKWEADAMRQMEMLLARFAHKKDNNLYLVPNVNALLFELDAVFERAR
jgi:hypothetical protein